MQKLKNIEFLRIFLIITIVLLHMSTRFVRLHAHFYKDLFASFVYARQGVEAFFIIAGFFLILTFKNIPVWDFIKKKFFRLMPMAMFSIIMLGIASIFHLTRFNLIPSLLSGFLLCNFGKFWCMGNNVALWYTSALFFGLIVFYLIIKFAKDKYQIPLFIILGFGGYLLLSILNDGMYNIHKDTFYGFLSGSTLRAFGGIGVGCLIGTLYIKYKDKIVSLKNSKLQNILFSFIELASFIFVTWWLCFKHIKIDNSIFILVFSVLFICFLIKKGFFSQLTDNNVFVKLGKYQYALFTIHIPIIRFIYNGFMVHHKALVCSHPITTILLILVILIISSILAYHIVEKPSYNFLMKTFMKGENCA